MFCHKHSFLRLIARQWCVRPPFCFFWRDLSKQTVFLPSMYNVISNKGIILLGNGDIQLLLILSFLCFKFSAKKCPSSFIFFGFCLLKYQNGLGLHIPLCTNPSQTPSPKTHRKRVNYIAISTFPQSSYTI